MLAIVVSRADSASEHVGEHLFDLADWREHRDSTRPDAEGGGPVYRTDGAELRAFDDLHLRLDGVGTAFGRVDEGPDREPDLLVFASRHSGETGALLTAHHTGNFGPAEFGGADGALARACPAAHRRVLAALREHAPEGYEVGTEATHHGPSAVGLPSMFVELGSDEPQWTDPDGARAVARAVLDLRGVDPDLPPEGRAGADGEAITDEDGDAPRRHVVGFGGGHYAPRFERVARETDWAVGHVAADWALGDMGDPADHRDVIQRAFAASAATRAVVEGDREGLRDVVDDLGYDVVSETWLRETTGVPLGLVERLEAALCPVAEGLRFGDRAADPADTADFAVVSLPGALLAEAQGVDAGATRGAVERATLAFETAENGTRAEGRAAVPDEDALDGLVDALAAVLRDRYETVERSDGAVVACETAFDPDRARTLGVEEGPAFGKLADGVPVEVDGRTIDPERVHVEREHRFPVGGE